MREVRGAITDLAILVPCYRRCAQLESKTQEKVVEIEGDTEGGWVDTHPDEPKTEVAADIHEKHDSKSDVSFVLPAILISVLFDG